MQKAGGSRMGKQPSSLPKKVDLNEVFEDNHTASTTYSIKGLTEKVLMEIGDSESVGTHR